MEKWLIRSIRMVRSLHFGFVRINAAAYHDHDSFTCKSRHTQCDEKKPVCSNCERLSLQCRPSEFITYSAWSSVGAKRPSRRDQDVLSADVTGPTCHSPIQTKAHALTPPNLLDPTPILELSTLATVGSSSSPPPPSTICTPPPPALVDLDGEQAHLLNIYRLGLATWMDIFDFDNTYQREVTRRSLYSVLLLRCICGFTAKHLSLLPSGEIWRRVASRYYGEVREIISPCAA